MPEPVTLAELKLHLRVTGGDEDALIAVLIPAAREWVENYTGLVLTPRTVTQALPSFAGSLALYAWPLAADPALTITYIDAAGVLQPVLLPRLTAGRPARILPAAGGCWPSSYAEQITVSVSAGYATPGDVPASLKAAMLLVAGGLYANREDAVVGVTYTPTHTVEALCRPYRLVGIG